MNGFFLILLVAVGAFLLNASYQRKRIILLGSHLVQFQLEKLMEDLTEGYMRALGEKDSARQDQIWTQMEGAESKLCAQFRRFTTDFAKLDPTLTRVSRIGLPYADQVFPQSAFDLRALFQIHADGLERAAANASGRSAKERAFVLLAELMLMQHSCHWFCRTQNVASARLVMRHQTAYAQVIEAVSPETRQAYLALTKG